MSPKPDFVLELKKFARQTWPSVKLGHSSFGSYTKYPCANPDGSVDNSDCPADDPLCNCPCQELKPSAVEQEPTDNEIQEKLDAVKECDLIEDVLGEEWQGCIWSNPDHPSSCNCPCVGSKFKDYIEYNRTYATYWDTPPVTPLWRNAQMMLLGSQKAVIILNGDLTLRPGTIINISNIIPQAKDRERRSSGKWLVEEINHTMTNNVHRMIVSCTRDSSPIDPNTSEELGFWGSILDMLGF
tara:strand:- start:4546 stop:5268 length:723 start_codon:yes stop_codon:yes gene_type:complete